MRLESKSFDDGARMGAPFAFGKPDPETHSTFAGNRNPHLGWSDVPDGVRSFVLICVDPDAPTVPDDVNQEGRTVALDLPRADFHHWVLVDVPADCRKIEEGACSDGVVPRGKQDPPGPVGSRQGVNDYTGWFSGDADLGGTYRGYDGPGPPWNDERIHRYHFQLFATDLERCPVDGDFDAAAVREAIEGHVLASATWTGTYTQNPSIGGEA